MKVYDGESVGSVEHAAKRKAAGSDASSGGTGRCPSSSGSRRKKAKVVPVAGLLDLPFVETPRPLTRGKLKQLAKCCDHNVEAILTQASSSASVGAARSAPTDGSTASSMGDGATPDV